ncbi:PQQ-like beta-propeller repeat protein [bacterium]|nr:PQQ-like beta-propeller repeat protein [bacterium]
MKLCLQKARYLGVLMVLLSASLLYAADWPQWRGINRDGISKETGLLKTWPPAGPKTIWKTALGNGYSAIAVSQGRIFTMASVGVNEYALCFDAATGKEIWRFKTDATYQSGQGDGPRSTPTVDGNWVYVLGAQSKLYALNGKDGKKIWFHDLHSEYGSEIPGWGTSTSPLVEGDLLLVDIGGKTGHSIGAFNKKSGALVWKTHTDKQGYSSPIAINANGARQILFFTGTSLVSVSPTGTVNWKYPWRTSYYANIATPIFIAPDKVYLSTAYDTGAAVLKLTGGKDKLSFQELWKSKISQNHFNSSVLHNDHIYGFDQAILQCIEVNTGKEKWKQSGFGKGSLILAEGNLIVLGERGQLALVEATPSAYKEKSRIQAIEGKTWTSPALANGKLYLRNEKEMFCMDLTGTL